MQWFAGDHEHTSHWQKYNQLKPMETLTSSNYTRGNWNWAPQRCHAWKANPFFKFYLCQRVHVKIPWPAYWNLMVEHQKYWGTAFKQQTRPTSSLGIHESDEGLIAFSEDTVTSCWFITIESYHHRVEHVSLYHCSPSKFIVCQTWDGCRWEMMPLKFNKSQSLDVCHRKGKLLHISDLA